MTTASRTCRLLPVPRSEPGGRSSRDFYSGSNVDRYCWRDLNDNKSWDEGETSMYATHVGVFSLPLAPRPSTDYTGSDEQHGAQDLTENGRTQVPAMPDPALRQRRRTCLDELDSEDYETATD